MKLHSAPGILFASCVAASTSSYAELLGFAHGRSADVSSYSQVSVEGALQLGDVDIWGARATAKVSDTVAVYGDFGFASWDSDDIDVDDGTTLGGGLIFELEGLAQELNTAVKVSYHRADFDENNVELEVTDFEVRGIISGDIRSQGSTPLSWYATAGLAFWDYEREVCGRFFCFTGDEDDTELALGAGIIANFGPGEGYVGAEYVDEFSLAAGYRFNF